MRNVVTDWIKSSFQLFPDHRTNVKPALVITGEFKAIAHLW